MFLLSPNDIFEEFGDIALDQYGFPSYYFEIDKFWYVDGIDMSEIWAAEENIAPEVLRNRIRFEEAFHVMTQFGYGAEWPSQFSTDEETYSTLVSECDKATCVWWQHPENNCPDMLS